MNVALNTSWIDWLKFVLWEAEGSLASVEHIPKSLLVSDADPTVSCYWLSISVKSFHIDKHMISEDSPNPFTALATRNPKHFSSKRPQMFAVEKIYSRANIVWNEEVLLQIERTMLSSKPHINTENPRQASRSTLISRLSSHVVSIVSSFISIHRRNSFLVSKH